MCGNMFNSVFVLFLVTFCLMLIIICCSIYIIKSFTSGLNNIVEAATKEAKEQLKKEEKENKGM